MNVHELRRYQMLRRVRRFVDAFHDSCADLPLVAELAEALDEALRAADGEASRQARAMRHARERTIVKADARAAVLRQLRAIRRTARALAIVEKGPNAGFRLPREPRDLLLAAFARGVLTRAMPFEQAFIAYAMPPTFLVDFARTIEDFETAIGNRYSATGAHVSARVGVEQAVARGFRAVRRLDVIVGNRFARDARALAAWRLARRVARSPSSTIGRLVPAVAVPERQLIATAEQRRPMTDEPRHQPHEIPSGVRPHLAA